MRVFHRNGPNDRGAVAVEFALILPVLLLIVVGTIEFGRVYSQIQVYNGAAREGARCAAVMATLFPDCNTLSDVQTRIDQASDPYPDPPDATITTGGVAGTGCTDDTIGEDVRVEWDQPFTINIVFMAEVTITPTIEATFRCE
jgi:Flp pilus assembly protein TadG